MRSTTLSLTAIAALAISASAAPVPPLACFGTDPIATFNIGTFGVASDLSGVAVSGDDGHMFLVNNGDAIIYEFDFADFSNPVLLNTFQMPMSDPEGIAWVSGRTFLVPDENPSAVFSCTFPATTASAVTCVAISSGLSPTPAGENQGFEGVAALSDSSIYAVQEMNAPRLWSINRSTGLESMTIDDTRTGLTPALSVFGDMTSSYDSLAEVFVLAKLPIGIFRVGNLDTTPTITDRYAGQICDMTQPEGLAFFKRAGIDYMIVVGEPTQVRIFQGSAGCTSTLDSLTGDMFACPVVETVDQGCEKVLEDGGCPFSRCDKNTTPNIKICTDTTPGETDCSELECKAHCDTTTDIPNADETESCTHWAYDVAERECYIFSMCNDIKFDADYVQYAMEDPTCEKTLADGGCPNRRCDKNLSEGEKVCNDDEPGVTDCTRDGCMAKCTSHVGFTCTTWAYDARESECYIFSECIGEKNSGDYTTYVLVDPTCESNLSQAGCPERRCSTLTNENTKVNTGDSASVEECRLKCALQEDYVCIAYAHDPVDKDCYTFKSCLNEGFSDDYTTYTLGYAEKLEVLATNAGSDDDVDGAASGVNVNGLLAVLGMAVFGGLMLA